jgi:hypothetical protein
MDGSGSYWTLAPIFLKVTLRRSQHLLLHMAQHNRNTPSQQTSPAALCMSTASTTHAGVAPAVTYGTAQQKHAIIASTLLRCRTAHDHGINTCMGDACHDMRKTDQAHDSRQAADPHASPLHRNCVGDTSSPLPSAPTFTISPTGLISPSHCGWKRAPVRITAAVADAHTRSAITAHKQRTHH